MGVGGAGHHHRLELPDRCGPLNPKPRRRGGLLSPGAVQTVARASWSDRQPDRQLDGQPRQPESVGRRRRQIRILLPAGREIHRRCLRRQILNIADFWR